MGKYMRKCRGIGEVAVMEVSQVVGVRTRSRTLALAAASAAAGSAKRRRVAAAAAAVSGGLGMAYLQLRSRSVIMTPRVPKSPASCARRNSPELDRLSRCSSNASSEVVRSGELEGAKDLDAVASGLVRCRERREATPSSDQRAESGDLESTAGRKPRRSRTAAMTPPEVEIEEFFAAAERREQQRFADTYNYDVVRDAPLAGRYEWVPLTQ